MKSDITSEANRLKQLSGDKLKEFLVNKFSELVDEKIITDYKINQNFNHKGFLYKKQYLANFIIETLDNKFIIINSSNSYRHDRLKLQSYDIEGVTNNASISNSIIASILLYPDKELSNRPLINFRQKVDNKEAYSPATHILVISELVEFLENHKDFVEKQRLIDLAENKDGSYYGIRGNAFEKEVVAILNNKIHLKQMRDKGKSESTIFNKIISTLCINNSIAINDLIYINSTDTVLKLKSGGNAKTDIIIILKTINNKIIETVSVKNTTQSRVSCHDYKCDDFIRVLQVEGTDLAMYLSLYQKHGSHSSFIKNFPNDANLESFEKLLEPYKQTLLEWALTGKHDTKNIIDPNKQISNYLLINKGGKIKFIDFPSYMTELYSGSIKLVYGLPLGWTYPSKQRGLRIQLKLPILI